MSGKLESWGAGLPEWLRFPIRNLAIDSMLPLPAARERMRGIVEERSLPLAGFFASDKLFAGEFSPERFKVMRRIAHHPGVSAIIEGSFEATPSGTRLRVTMRPTRRDQIGGVIWFAIGGLLLGTCVFRPLFNPHFHGSASFAMFMIMLLGAGYAMVAAGFNREVRSTEELLREALQVSPSARVREALSENAARRMPRFLRSLRTLIVVASIMFIMAVMFPSFWNAANGFGSRAPTSNQTRASAAKSLP